MQPGSAGARQRLVQFEPTDSQRADYLMGWTRGGDTRAQASLQLERHEEAIGFAEKTGLAYKAETSLERQLRPRTCPDNLGERSVRASRSLSL